MPKVGIHHIVLAQAATKCTGDARRILTQEQPMGNLGAIGPDMFFWGQDYDQTWTIYRLYQNFASVVDLYESIVRPLREIKDAVVEPIEDAVETLAPATVALIRHAVEEIKETSGLFNSAISTGLFAGVIEGADILTNAAGFASLSEKFYGSFIPDVQRNVREEQWLWFDRLHYQKTGEFARNLVETAKTDAQKAYAFGYLSHIATDVVGHPFVNQISGSPYRLNVARHVLAENFMDTWKFYQTYGESVNRSLMSRLGLPTEIPQEVAILLEGAFHRTYSGSNHASLSGNGGFYTVGQISETYDLLFKVLTLMGRATVRRPEEPFSGVADILADALSKFSPPPAPPSSSSACGIEDIFAFGLTSKSRDCYEEFIDQVSSWLDHLGELLKWTLATLQQLVDLVLACLLALPVAVLLAILYGIQLLCHEAYQIARTVLVRNGFTLPEPEDLDTSIAGFLTTPFQCQITNFRTFPKVSGGGASGLSCSHGAVERPTTAAGFHPVDANPDAFIHHDIFSEEGLLAYARCRSPEETRALEQTRTTGIGNAIDFTRWMIQTACALHPPDHPLKAALYTNWNLDADRGYGYHSWSGGIPDSGGMRASLDVANESYTTSEA